MTVVADQPITNIADDRFGRGEFAKRIAVVISSLNDKSSIVVSVNAPWGEGKSSVLNMIEEELKHLGNNLIIRFNPWRFSDEDKFLSGFFKLLAETIGTELEIASEKKMRKVKKAAKYLGVLKTIGVDTEGITDLIETYHQNPDVEEVRNRVNQALQGCSQRIVVFMDDIDRLDSREVQAVFRLVKLTADFPNTAYILAFDEKMVSASLAEQFNEDKEAGGSFLEKIVQAPLPVPPAEPRILRAMGLSGVESALSSIEVVLTPEEVEQFVTVFDKSFRQMLSSPRAVKRYTNMLNFALPILKGEINILDLILIEGVRAFYPRVYETVRAEFRPFLKDSLEQFLFVNEADKKARFGKILMERGWVKELTERERDGVYFALQTLFPHMREYGIDAGASYFTSNSDDWGKKKRICSADYFQRYFNYGIPPNDISDKDIVEFINGLSKTNIEQIKDRLETFCSGNRADTLIEKLRVHKDRMMPVDAGILAISISMRSDLIPESHPLDNFFMIGVLTQAAFLLRELIERENAEARNNLAKSVAKNIEGLPLAYEFRRKIRKYEKEEGSGEFVRIVSDECEQEIARILAEKLSRAVKSHPLEDSHPHFAWNFYIEWRWGNLECLRQYAQRRLERRPEDVGKFLSALTGISNDTKEDFGHVPIQDPDEEFKFLTDILAPDEWVKSINRSYPKIGINNLPPVVRWFVQMYIQKSGEDALNP